MREKMKIGRLAPKAKIGGRIIPAEDFIVKGISIPKNKAALCGQKANDKVIPNKKEPQYPVSGFLFFISSSSSSLLIKRSIINPERSMTIPAIFSP